MNPRAAVKTIFDAGLERVDPRRMVLSGLELENDILRVDTGDFRYEYDLSVYRRILVTGAGKAGAKMALGLEELLGPRIHSGKVAVKYGHTEELSRVELIEAGHPVPDENSRKAAGAVMDLCASAGEGDLVINLISGGGSAILADPYEDEHFRLSLDDVKAVTGLLLSCGASIHEINCVRKHLSLLKGGRLARIIAPAQSLSLILSDVVGDNLDVIASGLTVPDPTTYADTADIVMRYGLSGRLPPSVQKLVAAGVEGRVPETPKPGDPVFQRTNTVLLGTNAAAVKAASAKAGELGFSVLSLGSRITGEAREIAKVYAGVAKDAVAGHLPLSLPLCVIAGGETTVTLNGDGMGGRNQEMVLGFLNEFSAEQEMLERVTFLSAGTDGNDGPTEAAGGFGDAAALKAALKKGLSTAGFLQRNDSHSYLKAACALLITGPTNTNVCDLQIMIIR
ncbi:MAG: DUF4147 domain-containing protein [Spirochaetales bacterium]|nr:DUF4147 domain-containing protein [Spirochaetales bacterium]